MSTRSIAAGLITVLALFALCALPVRVLRAQGYGDTVDCRSSGYNFQSCPVPWRGARLIRQLSDTRCVRGQSWGFDRRGLWVDRGCAGRFVAADSRDHSGDGGGGGWRPEPAWDQRFDVSCGSPQYQQYFCQVDVGGGGRVYLSRQTSNTACVEGRTWGWNRAGIWVDQGCGGVFTIDRRWR